MPSAMPATIGVDALQVESRAKRGGEEMKTTALALLISTAWLSACGLSEIDMSLAPDLSGRVSMLMVSRTGTEACEELGTSIESTLKDFLAESPAMSDIRESVEILPYSDSKWVGANVVVHFSSPDDLDRVLTKMRKIELKVGEETSGGMIPSDFRFVALPPITDGGTTTWEVRVEGDLKQLESGPESVIKDCEIDTLTYRLAMPAPLVNWWAEPSSVPEGIQLDSNTVEWKLKKEGGPITLHVIARKSDASASTSGGKGLMEKIDVAKAFIALLSGVVALVGAWLAIGKRKGASAS